MIRHFLVFGGFIASLSATVFILDALYPPDLHRYEDLSRTVVAADETILRVFASADEKWRLPARLEDVDPRYIAFWLLTRTSGFGPILGLIHWQSSEHLVNG